MTNEKAIKEIKRWTPILLYSGETCTNHTMEAQLKAIASLEAWDKIKEELEKEMNEYENVLTDLSYSDGVGYALAVIEEHLKEIEE